MRKKIIGLVMFCLSVSLFAGGSVVITSIGNDDTPYAIGDDGINYRAEYSDDGFDNSKFSITGYEWAITAGDNIITGYNESVDFNVSGALAGTFTIEAYVEISYKDEDDNVYDPFIKDNSTDIDIVKIISIESDYIYMLGATIEKSDFTFTTEPDIDMEEDIKLIHQFTDNFDRTDKSGEFDVSAELGTSTTEYPCQIEVYHVKFQKSSDNLKEWSNIQYNCKNQLTSDTYKSENITWEVDDDDFKISDSGIVTLSDPDSIPNTSSIKITATSVDYGEECSDTFTLNVKTGSVDVTINGVSEEEEKIPGGYIMINDNDDNEDGNIDRYIEYSGNSSDQNLLKVSLRYSLSTPINEDYPMHLYFSGRVWDNSSRSGDPLDGNDYRNIIKASDIPSELYIEATSAVSRSVTMQYSHPDIKSVQDKVLIRPVRTKIKLEGLPNTKKIRENGKIVRIEDFEYTTGAYLLENTSRQENMLQKLYVSKPSCLSDLPESGSVSLSWTNKIELYESIDDFNNMNKITSPKSIGLSEFKDNNYKVFYVNPVKTSEKERDTKIKIEYTTPVNNIICEDKISITIDQLDLDVDSNNDGEVTPDNIDEDNIEYTNEHIGKILQITDDDKDNDDIIDNVDFEIKGNGFNEKLFAEVHLKLPKTADMENYLIYLLYSESDPNKIKDGKPDLGGFRLWKKQSNKLRNPLSIKEGGDFIAKTSSNKETQYTKDELLGEDNETILYVEAVGSANNKNIKVRLIPKKDAPKHLPIYEDIVKVTPIKVELLANTDNHVDNDNDGWPDQSTFDETLEERKYQLQNKPLLIAINDGITEESYNQDPFTGNIALDNLPDPNGEHHIVDHSTAIHPSPLQHGKLKVEGLTKDYNIEWTIDESVKVWWMLPNETDWEEVTNKTFSKSINLPLRFEGISETTGNKMMKMKLLYEGQEIKEEIITYKVLDSVRIGFFYSFESNIDRSMEKFIKQYDKYQDGVAPIGRFEFYNSILTNTTISRISEMEKATGESKIANHQDDGYSKYNWDKIFVMFHGERPYKDTDLYPITLITPLDEQDYYDSRAKYNKAMYQYEKNITKKAKLGASKGKHININPIIDTYSMSCYSRWNWSSDDSNLHQVRYFFDESYEKFINSGGDFKYVYDKLKFYKDGDFRKQKIDIAKYLGSHCEIAGGFSNTTPFTSLLNKTFGIILKEFLNQQK